MSLILALFAVVAPIVQALAECTMAFSLLGLFILSLIRTIRGK